MALEHLGLEEHKDDGPSLDVMLEILDIEREELTREYNRAMVEIDRRERLLLGMNA